MALWPVTESVPRKFFYHYEILFSHCDTMAQGNFTLNQLAQLVGFDSSQI